jgi:hypothetical protein
VRLSASPLRAGPCRIIALRLARAFSDDYLKSLEANEEKIRCALVAQPARQAIVRCAERPRLIRPS